MFIAMTRNALLLNVFFINEGNNFMNFFYLIGRQLQSYNVSLQGVMKKEKYNRGELLAKLHLQDNLLVSFLRLISENYRKKYVYTFF